MAQNERIEARRRALQEIIGMFEDGCRNGDTWHHSIAARLERSTADPAQQADVIQELLDLINGALIAGSWLGALACALAPQSEWTGQGIPPPDFPGQPNWPWTLLRDMADKVPIDNE
jgi:hypothetical protein